MRVPETWVDPDGPGAAYVELIDTQPASEATGPLVRIPRKGQDCVPWLTGEAALPALVELAEPGRIRLLPWRPFGERVIERRRELSQAAENSDDIAELVFLTERFRRVHIEKSGRFPLHDRELLHIGLGPSTGWLTLLVCTRHTLELWSEEFRRQWRQRSRHRVPWDEVL
jgi:hypothetical protein